MKLSRRTRKLWKYALVTAMGCGFLGGLSLWWSEKQKPKELAGAGFSRDFEGTGGDSTPVFRFQEVAAERGIVMRHGPGPRGRNLTEDNGSGLAWGDYDGDGDWDLYVVNYSGPWGSPPVPEGSSRLFRNQGGHFTDVTEAAGLAKAGGFGMGATFADYDDDGHQDLFVTHFGLNRLYHNRGDGTYEDVTAKAGVTDTLWSTASAWGDFDRDGRLDLYVCNYVNYNVTAQDLQAIANAPPAGVVSSPFTLNPNSFDPVPNRLYRNRGDGTFEEVAARYAVADSGGRSLGATFCDLDGDGWLDLYVSNDDTPNKLFRNPGRVRGKRMGRFLDISNATGTADTRGSMGISVAELGGMTDSEDSLPDLFITNWVAQENALYQSLADSLGKLEYRDRIRQLRLGEISIDRVGWGCVFADFDLDGRVDLAVANGSTLEQADNPKLLVPEVSFLFRNHGRYFVNVAPFSGPALAAKHNARGLAAADFDGDGDMDLAFSVNRGASLLLVNETPTQNRFLKIRLLGKSPQCFGARVEVKAAKRRWWWWYGGDASYLSMHAPEMLVGLGSNLMADTVKVRWADGQLTVLQNVKAGSIKLQAPSPRFLP